MKALGYRYVSVTEQSKEMIDFYEKLGLENSFNSTEDFQGGIFKTDESWLEIWQKSEQMPEMFMLQIIVDDSDAFAEYAANSGLDIKGPMMEHGEKIYSLTAPDGMPVTIQSKE